MPAFRRLLPILAPIAAIALAAPPVSAQSVGWKFLEAVRKKDGTEVDKMLGGGAGSVPPQILVNTKDPSSGDTALHVVTDRRDLTWMAFLIGKGADVNARNVRGATPLWGAVGKGFLEGVDLLIARGARVNDPGPAGETPLIAAVHQKNMGLVRALLKAGADPVRADNSGRTARDYAALDKGSPLAAELDSGVQAARAKRAKTYGPTF